jgi:hypothetical protein
LANILQQLSVKTTTNNNHDTSTAGWQTLVPTKHAFCTNYQPLNQTQLAAELSTVQHHESPEREKQLTSTGRKHVTLKHGAKPKREQYLNKTIRAYTKSLRDYSNIKYTHISSQELKLIIKMPNTVDKCQSYPAV